MAKYSYITDKTNNNRKIQVESAVRDGEGKNIVNNYAKQTGNYQTMAVGQASSIASDRVIDDIDNACPPITFGATGGNAEITDGFAKFKAIYGNSVVWNNYTRELNSTYWTLGDATGSFLNGIVAFTAQSRYQGVYQAYDYRKPIPANHKTFIHCKIKTTTATDQIQFMTAMSGGTALSKYSQATTDWQEIELIDSFNTDQLLMQLRDNRESNWDEIKATDFYYVDLTVVFGVGNEPTSLTDTRMIWLKQQLELHPEFNAGEIIDSQVSALDSTGRNQWDEEMSFLVVNWTTNVLTPSDEPTSRIGSKNFIKVIGGKTYNITKELKTQYNNFVVVYRDKNSNGLIIDVSNNGSFTVPEGYNYMKFACLSEYYGNTYKHDICIYIEYDTPNLPYVAFEKQVVNLPSVVLRGVGSVQDVIYSEGGGKRRLGLINLGDYDWELVDSDNYFKATGITPAIKNRGNNTAFIGICSNGYQPIGLTPLSPTTDKRIAIIGTTVIYVRDSAYSDATTFKNAMNGVYLLYELDSETDIDDTENSGWTELVKVNNYGTLLFTPTNNTKPQVLQPYYIEYTVNLVEFLDTAYVHTGGDGNNIALASEITDAALAQRGYVKQEDLSSGITIASITGLSASFKKAYKIGNQVFITIRLVNESGSDISANTVLFSVNSTIATKNNSWALPICDSNGNANAIIGSASGDFKCKNTLSNGLALLVDISYAIA